MKLIIAIIQDKFVNDLVREFIKREITITKLSSTGGFLKNGNTTFLIGVKDEELDFIKELIKNSVKSEEIIDSDNHKINVRGANLFVIDIDESLSL